MPLWATQPSCRCCGESSPSHFPFTKQVWEWSQLVNHWDCLVSQKLFLRYQLCTRSFLGYPTAQHLGGLEDEKKFHPILLGSKLVYFLGDRDSQSLSGSSLAVPFFQTLTSSSSYIWHRRKESSYLLLTSTLTALQFWCCMYLSLTSWVCQSPSGQGRIPTLFLGCCGVLADPVVILTPIATSRGKEE